MLPDGLAAPHDDVGARLADLPSGLLAPLPFLTDGSLQRGSGNAAGNGGSGTFQGVAVQQADLAFSPYNEASGGFHSDAVARQVNWMQADQTALQIAGTGGGGGDGNLASGGLRGGGASGSGPVSEGSAAGNGGDGTFSGGLIHTAIAVFDPVNIATAGHESQAEADQTNFAHVHQGATQIAGVGGHGGNGNLSAASLDPHPAAGPAVSLADMGGAHAGTGGDGSSSGAVVHASFTIFNPINIAVAGPHSQAHADQTNDLVVDQDSVQVAGVGGQGGHGNGALGGTAEGALLQLIGSDVIALGSAASGTGGSGSFAGSLADIDIAVYAPINIAVAGFHSTAEAHQSNTAHIDQSTTQIAGIGGDGGDGNFAGGGDLVLDLLDVVQLLT